MTMPKQREFLSFGDALFLYLERKGTPLHIASVCEFDGDISLAQLTRYIQSKLPQIPRYLQRVVLPPLGMGPPSWEPATDFDLRNHLHQVTLKHATVSEFKAAAATILNPLMDRCNPLWDVTLVHGLKGGHTGLIFRVHHCLADGISGIGLLNTLLETTPHIPTLPKRLRRTSSAPEVSEAAGARLIEAAMETWFTGIERILTASDGVLRIAQQITGFSNGNGLGHQGISGQAPSAEDLPRVLSELIAMPDRLPFNSVCRGPQRFEWTTAPFAELRAIKAATGTTINDIVLTVLTAALRRYCEMRGTKVKGRGLRIIVPVSVRTAHDSSDLGNHITFTPVTTPLHIRNPRKLLDAVHERSQFGKSARLAELVGLAGTVLGTIPPPLQAAIAPVLSELPISVCNTICTNVPGPRAPLYLLGRKLVNAYPYVPIGGEMGLNIAVLTYNGTAFFGFTGDIHAAPRLELLPRFLNESVKELIEAVGIKPHREKTRTIRRRTPDLVYSESAAIAEPKPMESMQPAEPEPAEVKVAAASAA